MKKINSSDFATALWSFMKVKNMTQNELAKAIGSTQGNLSKIFSGKLSATLDLALNACFLAGLSIDKFVSNYTREAAEAAILKRKNKKQKRHRANKKSKKSQIAR